MNQKQLITMWCGIAAIVLAGLTVIENYGLVCSYGFSVWVLIVALITGGLIYTFKGKGRKVKNTIQDIRDDILKKRRFKVRKDDYNKDKQNAIHSEKPNTIKNPCSAEGGERGKKQGFRKTKNLS